MPCRRKFFKHTISTVAAFACMPSILAGKSAATRLPAKRLRIESAVRRDETIVRHGGNGDIFPMTWMSGERQFASFSDGTGWSDVPDRDYNTRAIWVDGDPANCTFHELGDYPDPAQHDNDPRYYGFSVLAIKDRLYQFLCCLYKRRDLSEAWNGVKLIYSLDQGRTWHNQDGSTPVVWESYAERSRRSMLFFEEPQEAFSLMSLLQMGEGYEANRDGYVYGYGTNGNTDGLMNQLVMFRVPKARMLDRRAYEFFAGLKSKGDATWVKALGARAVVHTFPRGWVNIPRKEDENVVQAWVPSVIYNAPLGLYLMVSSGVGCPSDGDWFKKSKPSYLGFWTAPNPWGPWTQIHEELAWTPGNDPAARCYSPQIAPKWIAPDGKSFWLVWSDFQSKCDDDEWRRIEGESKKISDPQEHRRFQKNAARRCMPYYAFNTQRVDLVVREA